MAGGHVLFNGPPAIAQDSSGGDECDKQLLPSCKRTRTRSRGREEEPKWLTSSDPTDEPASSRRCIGEPALALALQDSVPRSIAENAALCGVSGQGSVQGAPALSHRAESQLQVASREDPSGRCDDLSVPVRCTAAPSDQLSLANGTPATPLVGSEISQWPLTRSAPDSLRALPAFTGGGALDPRTHPHTAKAGANASGGTIYNTHVQAIQQNLHLDGDVFRAGQEVAVQLTNAEISAANARYELSEVTYHARAAVADAQNQVRANTEGVMHYADQAFQQRVATMTRELGQYEQSVWAQQQERETSLRERVGRWEQEQVSEAAAGQAQQAVEKRELADKIAELQRQLQDERARHNRSIEEERQNREVERQNREVERRNDFAKEA